MKCFYRFAIKFGCQSEKLYADDLGYIAINIAVAGATIAIKLLNQKDTKLLFVSPFQAW